MNTLFLTLGHTLGPSVLPTLIITISIIGITLKSLYTFYIKKHVNNPLSTDHVLNAIIVLGAINVALGLSSTIWGFISMNEAIGVAGAYNQPRLIFGGISMALMPLLVSLLLFSVFAAIWFVLRLRFKKLIDSGLQV